MNLGLDKKTALVTGASSGLGLAIARELAAEGACVAIVARRDAELRKLAAEISASSHRRVLPIVGDVATPGDAERFVAETEAVLGPVDILVANAGGPPSTLFDAT